MIIKSKPSSNMVLLDKRIIFDTRLSFTAIGIYAQLTANGEIDIDVEDNEVLKAIEQLRIAGVL